MGHPEICSDGNPIGHGECCPTEASNALYRDYIPLSELKEGEQGTIKIISLIREIKDRLSSIGLIPDQEVQVIVKETWFRMKGFVYVAFPILIVGSSILGVVDELGLLAVFEDMLRPVFVGFLGLPAYAATAFIFGILRKEMALEILAVLAGTAVFIDVMTPLQIYVFALVATIYVPCAATIAVIGKELGWRNMVLISGFTIVLSIAVGGAANFLGLALL